MTIHSVTTSSIEGEERETKEGSIWYMHTGKDRTKNQS